MRAAFALALIAGLAACAQKPEIEKRAADSIDGQISEAVRVSDGMSRQVAGSAGANIVSVQNVDGFDEAPAQAVPVAPVQGAGVVLPAHAVQPITVTWNGELESFLGNVASRSGYVFKVNGNRPSTPMMIAIVADEEPMFGVVRRAGNMARGYADVVFNPSTKIIEIRYRG